MTIFEMQKEWQQKSLQFEERGDYYREQSNYKQALVEYAKALEYFSSCLSFTDRIFELQKMNPDVGAQTGVLFWLVVILKNITTCYKELKEYSKAAEVIKNLKETIETLGRFKGSFNVNLLKSYEELSQFTNLLEQAVISSNNLSESRGETLTSDASDETFNKLTSEFDKCTQSKVCPLPSRGYTYTSSSSCFIATAAYSTSIHPDLDTFREFRDKKLMVNPFGKLLVHVYYKISPSIARSVERNPTLKSFLRHQLEFVAHWMRRQQVTHE